jgi:hypothetical protein
MPERLANLQSLTIPSQDPDYGHLGQAFLPWPRPGRDAILQPPKPEIRPRAGAEGSDTICSPRQASTLRRLEF